MMDGVCVNDSVGLFIIANLSLISIIHVIYCLFLRHYHIIYITNIEKKKKIYLTKAVFWMWWSSRWVIAVKKKRTKNYYYFLRFRFLFLLLLFIWFDHFRRQLFFLFVSFCFVLCFCHGMKMERKQQTNWFFFLLFFCFCLWQVAEREGAPANGVRTGREVNTGGAQQSTAAAVTAAGFRSTLAPPSTAP